MSTTAELMKTMNKEFVGVVKMGNETYSDTPRIPTGIFSFDLASGGGFPQGRVSVVFGPESGNKTNIILRAIANAQVMYPDKKAVFVDAESSYDPAWAAIMGVNVDELLVVHPEYAEQAVDIMEAFMYATDVSMVVLDSIAALSTQNEIESSAEKASVGGSALIVGKMLKKATISFNRLRNQKIMPPAVICINQTRFKIGVMHGNPETMPGGNQVKFAASFIVRVYSKNIMDKKVHAVLPAYKETNIDIQKWKMPIVAKTAVFTMLMVPSAGKKPGTCEDWNTVKSYLAECGYLTKGEKGGWDFDGKNYKVQEDLKDALYADIPWLLAIKDILINDLKDRGSVLPPSADDE